MDDKTLNFSFRKVTIQDANKIFEWRNDPTIYRYLFNPNPIEWNSHIKWLNKLEENQSIFFVIATIDGNDCGTVRFDLLDDKQSAEVGIYVIPEFHGKKIGTQMLIAAEKFYKKSFPQINKVIARVIIENEASLKMFEKSGYQKNYIQLTKNI